MSQTPLICIFFDSALNRELARQGKKIVSIEGQYETLSQVAERLGSPISRVYRAIRNYKGDPLKVKRGKGGPVRKGKISELIATPEFCALVVSNEEEKTV